MSYLVLARKLRPTKFQDLVGQEHIWKTLITAIKTDRVAHAFLFTGPRGTGKTSCARVLTKALNCTSPIDCEPCNRCENCREITQGVATDVVEIDAASNRGIEHIRELRESVKFSPAKCSYKTYIIDEVHMLTTESFNALLKTLEEPPGHVKFILATTDHHKIPNTVISRCQRYDFANISPHDMVLYLKKVAQAESLQVSESALHLIAAHSAGGMRDALTALDMLIGFGKEQIRDDAVIELLGLNDAKEIDALLEHIVEKDLVRMLDLFHNLVNKGRSLARLLTDLLKSVKDLTLVKSLPAENIRWHDFLPEQLERYRRLAEKVTMAMLQQYFQILLEVERQIKLSAHARNCFEMGLIRMCSLESLAGVAEVISLLRKSSPDPLNGKRTPTEKAQDTEYVGRSAKSLESLQSAQILPCGQADTGRDPDFPEEKARNLKRTPSLQGDRKEGSMSAYVSDNMAQKWKGFVDAVGQQADNSLPALLRNAVVLEMDREKLVIGCANLRMFNNEKKKIVAKVARDFFQLPITVYYKEQTGKLRNSLKMQEDQELAEKEEAQRAKVISDPKVQEILNMFPNSKIESNN